MNTEKDFIDSDEEAKSSPHAITAAALLQYASLCLVANTNMLNTCAAGFTDYNRLNSVINNTKSNFITLMLAGASPAPNAATASAALSAFTNLYINNYTGYHADSYAGSTTFSTDLTTLENTVINYS